MTLQDNTPPTEAVRLENLPGRSDSAVVFVFVDGIGLGPSGPSNPFSFAPAPQIRSLLGGDLVSETEWFERSEVVFRGLDATLGVSGLPQSATGQTALFAGANGAAALGRHVTAFPGATLKSMIREGSVFLRAKEAGLSWTFANVRTKQYFELLEERKLRRSVTAWAVEAAGGDYRDEEQLRLGRALSWDVLRDRIELTPPAETVTALEAGVQLAALATDYDLVVYETFLTDFAGHGRFGLDATDVTARVDGLLGGVLANLPPKTTLVVSSDHGNFEDLSTKSHTMNLVPLIAVGPRSDAFARAETLLDVYSGILNALDICD